MQTYSMHKLVGGGGVSELKDCMLEHPGEGQPRGFIVEKPGKIKPLQACPMEIRIL